MFLLVHRTLGTLEVEFVTSNLSTEYPFATRWLRISLDSNENVTEVQFTEAILCLQLCLMEARLISEARLPS